MAETTQEIALRHFYFPVDIDGFIKPISDFLSIAQQPLIQSIGSFAKNLSSVISTASLPFWMGMASVSQKRFLQLHTAEKIRARKHADEDGNIPEWAATQAYEIALKRAEEESLDETRKDATIDQLFSDIVGLLNDPSFNTASREVLRQGTVLTWSSIEVLATDLFIALLNTKPELVNVMFKNDRVRKWFDMRGVSLEILGAHGFDVSKKMGDILIEHYSIDTLPAIKTIFSVLSPERTNLTTVLDNPDLYLLNKRRNLIVHRRSIVDMQYKNNTSDSSNVGDELYIKPDDLDRYLAVVRDAGKELIDSACNNL
jgi:hypothetical protein